MDFFKSLKLKEDEREVEPAPILRINGKPYAKMYHYCQAAPGEVSVLGRIRSDGDNVYTVLDVELLEQECSAASTDMDEQALTDFVFKIAKRGGNPSEYNFWFHTHGHGGVFWSGVDDDNCERHSQKTPYFALVMNKCGEMVARRDFQGETCCAKVVVVPTGAPSLMKECYSEVRKKVRAIIPAFKEDEGNGFYKARRLNQE